jgi:hypothetical protein
VALAAAKDDQVGRRQRPLLAGSCQPDLSGLAGEVSVFAPADLEAVLRDAEAEGYLAHELGDSMLVVS